MKIKAKIFKDFIKKASLDSSIMTINLDFKESGIHSAVKTFGSVGVVYTSLKKEAFEEYKTHNEMYIRNTKAFLTYLNTFDDVITLDVLEDYILKIHDEKREGHIILGSKVGCENIMTDPLDKIKTTFTTEISKKDLTKTIKDMDILGISSIDLEWNDGVLSFTVGQKGESEYFINKFNIEGEGSALTRIGILALDVYNVLTSKVTISFGTNTPAIFEEETEFIKFRCILAPMVENNGD